MRLLLWYSSRAQQGGSLTLLPCAQGDEVTLAAASVTVLPGPVEPAATIVQLLPSTDFSMTSSTTVQVRCAIDSSLQPALA